MIGNFYVLTEEQMIALRESIQRNYEATLEGIEALGKDKEITERLINLLLDLERRIIKCEKVLDDLRH